MTQAVNPKKPAGADWHRADIVAALHKKGWSLRSLASFHGYKSPNVLVNALARRWPKGQRLIARAIGVPPESIWPSRYQDPKKDTKRRRQAPAGRVAA